jgi:hypothetical protein
VVGAADLGRFVRLVVVGSSGGAAVEGPAAVSSVVVESDPCVGSVEVECVGDVEVFRPGSFVVGDEQRSEILSWVGPEEFEGPGVLTVAASSSLADLPVGTVVAIPFGTEAVPGGALVRVVAVTTNPDGTVRLDTESAGLPDLYARARITSSLADTVDITGQPIEIGDLLTDEVVEAGGTAELVRVAGDPAAPQLPLLRSSLSSSAATCRVGDIRIRLSGKVVKPTLLIPGIAGLSLKLSGSVCLRGVLLFDVRDGSTRFGFEAGFVDSSLSAALEGPSIEVDDKVIVDFIKLDDLIHKSTYGAWINTKQNFGFALDAGVKYPFKAEATLTGSKVFSAVCDGELECSAGLTVDNAEARWEPSNASEIIPGNSVEFRLGGGIGYDTQLKLMQAPAVLGPPTEELATLLDAKLRATAAFRGTSNPDLVQSDRYRFNWALFGEARVGYEFFKVNLGTYFGVDWRFSGPSVKASGQLPLLRSEGLSFTNFNESRAVPSVVSIGYEFPLVVANVVPVDGQITTTSGRFRHPSSLGGIPVTIALHTAVETSDEIEAGPIVPGGLEGTTTETSNSSGVVEFDDLRSADNVAPGRYVLRVTATDPDGDPFLLGDGVLEGVSDAFDMKQVEWFPTAVPHPGRVQLGWPEYQLDQGEDGSLAGYRIYRLDRDDDEPSLPEEGTMPYDVVGTDVIDEPYCSASSTPPADAYGGCVTWTDPDPQAINQRYTYVVAPCFSRSLVPGLLTCPANFGAGGSTTGFYEGQPIDIPRAPGPLQLRGGFSQSAVLDSEPQDYDGYSSFAWVGLPVMPDGVERVRLYSCSRRLASDGVHPQRGPVLAQAFGSGWLFFDRNFIPYPASARAFGVENTDSCTSQQQPHHNPGWFTVRVQPVGAIRFYPGPFPTDRRPGAPLAVQFNFIWGRVSPKTAWSSTVYTRNLSPWPADGSTPDRRAPALSPLPGDSPTGLTRFVGPGPVEFPPGCLPAGLTSGPCTGQQNDGQVADVALGDPALQDLALQCDHAAWLTVINDRGQESPLSRKASSTGVDTSRFGGGQHYFEACEPDPIEPG